MSYFNYNRGGMRQLFSFLLVFIFSFSCIAQSLEAEPNNDFATAGLISSSDTITASVGGADAVDFFKPDINYWTTFGYSTGSIIVYVIATNTGSSTQRMKIDVFNGLQGSGLVYSDSTTSINPGATQVSSFRYCGQYVDDFYMAFTSTGEFNYKLVWYFSDPNRNTEPNDSRASASTYTFDTLNARREAIRYQYRQNVNTDTADWFKTIVPPLGAGNFVLRLEAKNNSCQNSRWIQYAIYKNNVAAPLATGYVGNNQSVSSFVTVVSDVNLGILQTGDSIFIHVWANAAFGYNMRYRDGSRAPYDDDEDNCCTYNAVPMAENEIKGGNVGEYDSVNDYWIDEYDTYRLILPHDGTLKLHVSAENAECGLDELSLLYDILDKYGNEIIYGNELMYWNGNPACNTLLQETLTLRGFVADTFYLRLRTYSSYTSHGGALINYNIRYEMLDDAVGDAEPNDNTASAIAISQGQVVKGHIKFQRSDAYYTDYDDHYKTVLPTDGKIKVYIKIIPRAGAGGIIMRNNRSLSTNAATGARFYYLNNNQQYTISTNHIDSVKIDTILICPATAGTANFLLTTEAGGGPFEYEFWYELVDASPWTNDVEFNNTFETPVAINYGETKTGRLRYYEDRQGGASDVYDYYKTATPYAGRVKVYVEATNTSCVTASAIKLTLFDKRKNSGQLFTKNIGNLTTVPANTTIYDTIITCRIPTDTVYFRFETSPQPFRYKFRYEIVDTTLPPDIEPDNSFAEATVIGSGQTRNTLLGLTYNGQLDMNDYFRVVVPVADSFKLHWKATNISCVDNRYYRIWVYNKSFQQVFFRGYILNAVGTIDAGQTREDSTSFYRAAGDTLYIRFNADGLFDYTFRTGLLSPSPMFKIAGDTTACEGPQYVYKATNIVDSNVSFHWSLPLGGGTIVSANDSIATVIWNASGNRRVQLHLTNAKGNTIPRQLNIVVNGVAPTQTPVAYNFARTLSTNSLPPGSSVQWFRNGVEIPGATDSTYYAADAGTYRVAFVNDCGPGPHSNAIVFNAAALPQTITLPHTANITMAPNAKTILLATSSSALPVFYQKISGPGTLLNDTLTVTGVGTIIVKAIQPGDDVYSPATPVYDTITVIKGDQFIIFDSIPSQVLNSTDILLDKTSSVGLTITYTVVGGTGLASVNNLSGSASSINKLGAGLVTLRATQNGNANYNAAIPVERTFCIGIRTLTPITGGANPCLATYRYNTQKIPGAIYEWTLSGGGILTTNKDTAWVQWNTEGTHTLKVKAFSPCDSVYTEEQELSINTSGNPPAIVSGMQPLNGALDQKLPLKLSWIPGSNTVSYDLYVWDSTATEPATPYAANLTTVSYTLPKNSFAYNKAYKWRVVSKNPCTQTAGPVQSFRIIPLPDLVVSDVQAPLTANSGQTITVSWKVTNIGPGKTFTDDTWSDGVYFALDTVPHVLFNNSPNWNASSWSSLTANGRPLLLGKKLRPTALDVGQSYTNSLQFTLPAEYSFPVYVYVITDNGHPNYRILQASVANDSARAPQPMNITLSPTPDLRVDSVFAPVTTFSGSTINLTYKVKNYGVVTPAGENWTDSVFISQNPLFDRNVCIPLMLPKQNGSYYPNAKNAFVYNNEQLDAAATVTKNLQVVIPNFIFGTWFIYVKTNAGTKAGTFVYEGSLNGNNINQAQVQVFLTPTPKLTIQSLLLPQTTVSTTQTVGINWRTVNEGFTDNLEKSKGHYLYKQGGGCPCGGGGDKIIYASQRVSSSRTVSSCVPPPKYLDSLAQGSSYWVDRIYISTDSSGLNLANARLISELKNGLQQYAGVLYSDDMTNCLNLQGAFNVKHALYPGSEFPKDTSFRVPADLQPGNYYIYIYTNPTKTVFEYPGTPQIKRSTLPITVSRPDAVVSSISVPTNSVGGQQIIITYNVTNNGPGAVFNHARIDQLYISNFPNFDASAELLSSQIFTENLPVGIAVPHSFTYQLPGPATGAKYFYVLTNADSSFKETNSSNNLSAAAITNVSAAIPADLTVTSIQLPDTVFTIFNNTISYTVSNSGSGTTAGTWTDSLFVSCSPIFNPATAYFIAAREQTREIGSGQSYSDTFSLVIPKMSYEVNSCFPQTANSPAYFFIKANADTVVYEASNVNNNVTGMSKVLANPLVDHIVSSVTLNTDSLTVGRAFAANWTVKNIGYKPPYQYYNGYSEGIFISADSVYTSVDERAGSFIKYTYINRNDSARFNASLITPNLPTGDYYVFAVTNYSDGIPGEKLLSNNANLVRNPDGTAKKIHLFRPILPDLTDSILAAPATVIAGQPFTIIRRITNKGAAQTYPSTWSNRLLLSADFSTANNQGDVLLSEKNMQGILLPGEFRYDTVTVTTRVSTVPGNYIIIGEADSRGQMAEAGENNNLAFSLIAIEAPPITDLLVESIIKPDTVYLGYTIDTAKWVVRNGSPNEAKGKSTDGIYLSKGDILDSTAILLGVKNKTIDLDPLTSDTVRFAPLVTGVTEGDYNVVVRTDLLNNFLEEDKENNTAISITPIHVKVKELQMNVVENNTLHAISRFYKLRIPDSLIGSTILVTLKTPDSLLVRNEIFMGAGYVPTAARYDYKFEIPNYGNQQILMNEVADSVYYIDVRCVTPNAPVQNITLKAAKLPFAILNVHTNAGGNIGNVTVKINGSLFTDSMTAKLSNGGATIHASAVYFTNSTTAYATFPLQGKPLGVYDVTLTKTDLSTAVLENGFSVVQANNGGLITGGGFNTGAGNGNEPGCDPGAASGLNSQLVVELLVPERVLIDRPVVILVNYSNPTNFDIPAQTKILYAENDLKLSFTKEGVATGTSTLYLEFTEPGGPPGIIRAGGSGTITIYTKAPHRVPDDGNVLFKMK